MTASLKMVRQTISKIWLANSCNRARIKACQSRLWSRNLRNYKGLEERGAEAGQCHLPAEPSQELSLRLWIERAKKVTKIQMTITINPVASIEAKRSTKRSSSKRGKSTRV